jgi:hypothetical protein
MITTPEKSIMSYGTLVDRLSNVETQVRHWPPTSDLIAKIAVLEALSNERHHSNQTEINKAFESLNKRLEGMNEFRESLKDQAAMFLPRIEWQTVSATRDRDVQNLRIEVATLATHTRQTEVSATAEREGMNRRLELMNEFRQQIKDQAGTFLPRAESDARYDAGKATLIRLELMIQELISRKEIDLLSQQTDARMKLLETKLSNWDGRLWAFGVAFTLLNIVVSWGLSSIRLLK